MVSAAEIDALYASTLEPRLAALEGLRSEVTDHIKRAAFLVGVPAVLLWANDLVALALPGGFGWLATAVPLVALLAGLIVAAVRHLVPGFAAFSNYRVRFKHEVAAEVFKIVCPTAAYAPLEGIAEVTFDEAGLFNLRGHFKSDDRVRGRIGQTPFEAADVSRSYTTGGENKRTVVVFRGLFFHLDFNKTLRGITLVDPKTAASTSVGDRSGLTEVTLENPAFEAGFRVHASDEVEARYILTPAIMERILTLQARTERPVHLAFRNNRAFLGVNYGRALFEPAIAASTSLAAIHEMAAHFALAEGIVHELDLNTRIWTKGVDESLLTSAVAVEPDAFDLATKQGNVTPEALWAAAMEASGHGDDEAAEVVMAAPPGTSIQIDRAGSAVTIDYGLGFGFYLALVVWMAAVALALAAVRVIPTALHMGDEIVSSTAWLPEIPYASQVVTTLPVVWFVGACLVGAFAFLMWGVRVRKVEIAADAVRIWRGLRPLPRIYRRPPYGKVVRLEKAVYVGKTTGFALLNATASPMLSPGDVPWVASEMRRAMRETAR
ncbi:MAG: DUF3137 domain-containing protein [Acidobacteria bacterium]|nr:DUF3137 domain-containing protein [Acidobacteriota bacterium]